MKSMLIKKNVIGLLCLVGTSIVPVVVLSSCSAAKTYFLPITTGDLINKENNPWNTVLTKNPNGTLSTNQSGSLGNAELSYEQFSKYLPSAYVYDKSESSSYSYSQFDKIKDDKINGLEGTSPQWNSTSGTYLSNDAKTLVSNRNAVIDWATYDINNSISSSLTNYYLYCLNFISQTGIVFNNNESDWYNMLFGSGSSELALGGSFDHGTKESDQNKQWYSFLFALKNLLGLGKNGIEFGLSNINFQYLSNIFGPGPLLTTDNINYVGNVGTYNGTVQTELSNGVDATGVSLVTATVNNLPGDRFISPYVYKTYDTKNNDTQGKLVSCTFSPIPYLIQPTDIDFKYYDYRQGGTFQTNDYTINDLDKINSAVKKSGGWKSYAKKTGTSPEAISTAWSLANQNVYPSSINNDEISITDNNISSTTANNIWPNKNGLIMGKNDDGSTKIIHCDYALSNLYSTFSNSGEPIQPHSNDFICFANYSACIKDNDDDSQEIQPFFTGTNGVYPVWSLMKLNVGDDNLLHMSFDTDLLKKMNSSETDEDSIWTIDQDKLNTKMTKTFSSFFSSVVSPDKTPFANLSTEKQLDIIYSAMYFNNIFGSFSSTTNPNLSLSSDFLNPTGV